MKPKYLWFPLTQKTPKQFQHVIAILRCGAEVETYLAHEKWHIVDGTRTIFEDVVFWRYMDEEEEKQNAYERGFKDGIKYGVTHTELD